MGGENRNLLCMRRFQGWDSGHQAWRPKPLPSELSYRPSTVCFETEYNVFPLNMEVNMLVRVVSQ